ncbi:MAG: hypothetical protein HRT63_07000 [Erythrobacter sp.]|nr:hypothetical protein [Erythrobacter sp.]
MYSEDDINSAVAAGALSAEAAESFRTHMSAVRDLPRSSEEEFRLLNSFNDIFVSIGIVILLVALAAIGQWIGAAIIPVNFAWSNGMSEAQLEAFYAANARQDALQTCLAGLLIAASAWPLSEFFTRKRRMALPSILLLLAFVGGVFASVLGLGLALVAGEDTLRGGVIIGLAGVVACGAAYIHWRRFAVPITVAAGTGVLVIALLIMALAVIDIELGGTGSLIAVLLMGLGVFAIAMRWDMSDRERTTRRSDVAFWLHLLAAPMIAHPVFALLGVTDGDMGGIGAALAVVAVYIAFGCVALAIDRRALLVSALAYVLFALAFLFNEFGAVELSFALTAFVLGSALLSLSAFWQPIRAGLVGVLPESVQAKLPAATDTGTNGGSIAA